VRRKALAVDKIAAQAMLNELVRNAEREKAGLIDPTDAQRKRLLAERVVEFECYLRNKDVTPKQVYTAASQLRKIVAACDWKVISDITDRARRRPGSGVFGANNLTIKTTFDAKDS
jgi:hypothetical protein